MLLEELDFEFPEELIAQRPCEPRDACRLLVADPIARRIEHTRFARISDLLQPGDVLVVNESKVFPARAWTRRVTGGRVELLFLAKLEEAPPDTPGPADTRAACEHRERWEALARPSAKLREGETLSLPGGEALDLVRYLGDGRWIVERRELPGVLGLLEEHGEMPLPPYIRRPISEQGDYQTVYANTVGSAAAPTAGLHFTESLLERLEAKGVSIERVTLHVGVDTFRPITEERVEDHPIHSEHYAVSAATVRAIDEARGSGRRVVAVGTTSVRVLETLYADALPGGPAPARREGATKVYITPGYRFRAVDALLTNFHLPRTSLLALVMAFGGVRFVGECYAEAVRERYRFFSFGDAMLLTARVGAP